MAEQTTVKRPVARPMSPHLQVYTWGIHMAVSIIHRMTGSALAVGAIALVWFLVALANGPAYMDAVADYADHWLGRLFLFGMTFALLQHMGSGIRHLFMDTGALYDLDANKRSAALVFVFSIFGTIGVWVAAYSAMGVI